jgi:hypothetical protein
LIKEKGNVDTKLKSIKEFIERSVKVLLEFKVQCLPKIRSETWIKGSKLHHTNIPMQHKDLTLQEAIKLNLHHIKTLLQAVGDFSLKICHFSDDE